MIEVTLKDWNEKDLQHKVVQSCVEKILHTEFSSKPWEDGYYTPHDKFKNQVANLVADRIYEYMIGNEEIKARIDKAIDNAEKTIVTQYMLKAKEDAYRDNKIDKICECLEQIVDFLPPGSEWISDNIKSIGEE